MAQLKSLLPLALLAACAGQNSDGPNKDKFDTQLPQSVFVPAANISEARVIHMNEEAMEAKLNVIDAAVDGDSLDLVYYIWSDDESSSFMSTRIIAAVERGAKVRILLDYITNIGRFNYYKQMKEKAESGLNGSLNFAFYNAPTDGIMEHLQYILTPCSLPDKSIMSEPCRDDRLNNFQSAEAERRAVLLLSGLFGSNQEAMGQAVGAVLPQYQAAASAGGETSEEDKAAAAKGLQLIFQSKVQGDPVASAALFFMADRLQPLTDAFDSVAPGEVLGTTEEWEHMTDYVHQKMTLLTPKNGDELQFVVGGRNIENSYNLSSMPEGFASKYIFLDTDFYSRFTPEDGKSAIQARYDKLWFFEDMVTPLEKTERLRVDPTLLPTYEDTYIADKAQDFSTHYNYTAGADLEPKVQSATYKEAIQGQLPTINVEDGSGFHYVENIPNPQGKRVFGTQGKWKGEKASGKFIHQTWLNALENVCDDGESAEVVIHNAYLIMPTRLQRAIMNAVVDPSSCRGVRKFTIITNSMESTDLNIINVYNESYIKPILDGAPDGRLDYFEYTTNKITPFNPVSRSLHSKVMIFGDDIFVGSANADGRSEFMDANNGVFITKAPLLTKKYIAWLRGVALPELAAKDPHGIQRKSHDQLLTENMRFLNDEILERFINFESPDTTTKVRAQFTALSSALCQQLNMLTGDAMLESPSEMTDVPRILLDGSLEPARRTNQQIMIDVDQQLELL